MYKNAIARHSDQITGAVGVVVGVSEVRWKTDGRNVGRWRKGEGRLRAERNFADFTTGLPTGFTTELTHKWALMDNSMENTYWQPY